ncbi:hypothetical protein G7043_39710 [Lentzea sp. NEAU-D13]|uniref:Uncharacterized protein n=1 Tax=Lentzea alba TaxID=2714351 RepID=A0A7C9W316_9PSEU|nr:hypothetical protein [Lentzea alba]NGY65058.1 hypothetical protein [Lentzea alba]
MKQLLYGRHGNSGEIGDCRMTEAKEFHRYALPASHPVLLDDDGFLLPPPEDDWLSGDDVRPVAVTTLPKAKSSFALLGAGGAGKTSTFEALAKHEPLASVLNVAPLTRDSLERKLAAACEQHRPIYLDGLDQAALHDPRLLQWLEDELTSEAARLVPWRLACRSAAWEASLAHVLKDRLPDFTEWKLLPLDRVSAEVLASAQGHDGERFIAAIVEADLGRLSACAGQLLTTAKYWSTKGRLPSGSVEAMQFEIDQFLAEPNNKVLSAMPIDRARVIAKRLGAFTAFSSTQSLSLAPHEADGVTLSVDQLPSSSEPAAPSSPVMPEDYRSVLRTALFDFAAPGLLVFRHQMYVEYLAAAYLVDRRATPEQVATLLGADANGVLPTSRIGVAAWIAALKPELVERLIADNVETFAFSAAAVEISSDPARAAVVEALLDAAARDDQQPRWNLDLTGLVHSTLEGQLSRRLPTEPADSQLLWWLSRLAIAGRCEGLARQFAEAAQDTTHQAYARRAAIFAADRLGNDEVRRSLRTLLDGDLADPDNEILCTLIEVLYPRLLTTDDLASVMRPHRSILYGNYRQKLRVLADDIPTPDLARFIRGLAAGVDDESDVLKDYYELPTHLLRRAWPHADDPQLRTALAELVAASVRSHHWNRGRQDIPWAEGPVERRRALALELARMTVRDWYAVVTTGLICSDDVAWLVDQLPALLDLEAETLSTCLSAILHDPSAESADLILGLSPEHPAYEATNHLRGASELNSPAVAKRREMAAQDHAYKREQTDRRTQARHAIAELLDGLEADPALWWKLTYLLTDDDNDAIFNEDLTARPGWQHLTEDERVKTLQAGIRYLHVHQPEPKRWCGFTSLNTGDALSDWEGVRLLSTLARHTPEILKTQGSSVWTNWSHSIIATWLTHTSSNNEPMRHALLNVGMTLAPEPILDAALHHLDDLEAAGRNLSSEPVYRHLGPHIGAEVARRLLDGRYSGELARDVLDLVAQQAQPATALDTCLQLRNQDHSKLASRARAHLATIAPNLVIDEFDTTAPTAAAVAEMASRFNIIKLDHAHLVRAASHLLNTYPYAEDQPLQPGFAYTPAHHAQELRGRLLQQLADNGHAQDLDALRQGRPELDHNIITSAYLRTARSRQAELTLTPTTADDLLELLRSSDARLVHNDADLVRVVLHMLAKLQHSIKHEGAFRDIWNDTTPQTEDDISDWIRRRCHELSSSGIVVNRELHVVRNSAKGGIGTRIDLTAESRSPTAQDAFVVIEAKRIDNNELLTSISQQLIELYLKPLELSYGIYLAYWIRPDQRPKRWSHSAYPTAADLLEKLEQQAEDERTHGVHITPYVLDISRPT